MATVTRLAINSALPTWIARELLKYTMPNLVAMPLVTRADKWSGVQSYGGVITIPTFLTRPSPTQLNAGSDSPWAGSAEADPPSVTFSAPTISSVSLVIDQWWYYAFRRTVYADAINNGYLDWDSIFKQGGMDGLRVKIDATLTTLYAGHTGNGTFGVDGSPLTIPDIVNAVKALDALNVPDTDRAWVFSTGAYDDATQLEAISNQLYIGDNGSRPVVSGKIDRNLWGYSVHKTTNLSAGTAGLVGTFQHKQADAIAMRREPFALPSLDLPSTATRDIPMHAVWGVKELRDNFGCYMAMET